MNRYIKRLQYSELQFLREPDFTDEQSYHRTMRYQHNLRLHTKGIAYGMTVTKSSDKKVLVSAGMAMDGAGQEIILFESEEIDLAPFNKANNTFYLIISFGEQDADGPIPDPDPSIRNRTEEKRVFNLVDVKPAALDIDVLLAEIDLDVNGIITAVRDITTSAEIPDSGARIAKNSVNLDHLHTALQAALKLALEPKIDSFTPAGGPTGTAVTINGEKFIEPLTVEFTGPANTRVTGDNIVVDPSGKQITTNSPAGIVDGKIYVRTAFGEAESADTFFPA